LDAMAPAISGQGGHDQTFDAACALVLGFNLSISEARPILGSWNLKCQPPWSEQELSHKLADADKAISSRPRGYLLHEGHEDERANGTAKSKTIRPSPPRMAAPTVPESRFSNWDFDDENTDEDAKPRKEPADIQEIALSLGVLKPGWPKRVGEQ